jgi:hypothetical protein
MASERWLAPVQKRRRVRRVELRDSNSEREFFQLGDLSASAVQSPSPFFPENWNARGYPHGNLKPQKTYERI